MKLPDTVMDVYHHSFHIDTEKHDPVAGGQGVVVWTADPDLVLKLAFKPGGGQELDKDDRKNDHYMDLRLMPLPLHGHFAMPQSVLKGYRGYVMTLLDDMDTFQEHFALDCKDREDDQEDKDEKDKKIMAPETVFFRQLAAQGGAYAEYAKMLRSYMGTGGSRRRCLAYFKAAVLLDTLHANDLVYCDFSPRNIDISKDLAHSNVWLFDMDNLRYAEQQEDRIFTPGFCAPEVRAGEGDCSPYADAYSFAVSLFGQLLLRQPFEGPAYEAAAEELDDQEAADELRDCGEFPWILEEGENRVPDEAFYLPYQHILTDDLYALFAQTFSEESRLEDASVRPPLSAWALALAYAFDNMVYDRVSGCDYLDEGESFGVCPWGEPHAVPTLRARAYAADEEGLRRSDRVLWQCTHECAKVVLLPLRLVAGFSCADSEAAAFTVDCAQEHLTIRSELPYDWTAAYSDDGMIFEPYGSYHAEGGQAVIHCLEKKGGTVVRSVRVEIEMG